jgi:hypothetical protein
MLDMRRIFLRLTASILAGAVSSLALAQPGVTIRTTTSLVQVSVVAHDAKGNPVPGLTKDDFEILDNGRLQKVATFAAEQSAPVARRDLPANTFTNRASDPRPRAAATPSSCSTTSTPAIPATGSWLGRRWRR